MYNFIESIFTASTPSEARQALMVFINFTVAILLIAGGITIFARNVKSTIVNAVLNVTSVLISFVPFYVVINNLFNLNGELDIPSISRISQSAYLLGLMKLMSILILVLISIIPTFSNPLSGIKSLSEVNAEWEAEKRIEARKQAEEEAKRQQERAEKQAEEEAKRQQEQAEKQAEEEAKRQKEQAEKQAMADLIAESIIKKMKADEVVTIILSKESLKSTAE